MVKPKYKDLSELQTYTTQLQSFAFKFAVFVVLGLCMYGILWGLSRLLHVENSNTSTPKPFRNNGLKCFDRLNSFKFEQRGSFWVLENYIRANRWFRCDESVTLALVGDLASLDQLQPLVERWKGPISLALYTPRTDFEVALLKIKHLSICGSSFISQLVTFHFYFEGVHRPSIVPPEGKALLIGDSQKQNFCSTNSTWYQVNRTDSYRMREGLPFPINVGRNVARKTATTHFILSSNIQFYPNENLVPTFLTTVKRNGNFFHENQRSVFVLPAFEVDEMVNIPSNKTELLLMLKKQTASVLRERSRFVRQSVPKYDDWLEAPTDKGLVPFYTTKRYEMWEPYFIGTNWDPNYDERLTREGQCDRITQAYAMCLMGYDYHVLNNAFIVRKRARERLEQNPENVAALQQAIMQIKDNIGPELNTLHGVNESCWLNSWYYP